MVDSEIVRINRVLALRLFEAEEQLRQVRARRREDGRANARAAEILAEHRNAWLETEHSLLNRLEDACTVESELRARVDFLERELLVAKSANADDATDGKERREIGAGEGEVEGELSEEGLEEEEEEGMVLHEEGIEDGLELDEIAAMIYQQRLRMPMPLPPMDGHGPQNNANYHCTDANWFDLHNPSSKPNHIPWQVIVFIGSIGIKYLDVIVLVNGYTCLSRADH